MKMNKADIRKEIAAMRPDPAVQIRLRAFELESLRSSGQTKCDICSNVIKIAEAMESWKGNVCLYVSCISCLSKAPLQIVTLPDGIHINYMDGQSTGFIRGGASLIPNTRVLDKKQIPGKGRQK
jgi:hypothetical protein